MDSLYLLVPLSVLLVFALMALFAWALRGGQFDDLGDEGARILVVEGVDLDADQVAARPSPPHCAATSDRE